MRGSVLRPAVVLLASMVVMAGWVLATKADAPSRQSERAIRIAALFCEPNGEAAAVTGLAPPSWRDARPVAVPWRAEVWR